MQEVANYVAAPKDTGPGSMWSEFRRDILGRDVRVTFPITKIAHDGGSTMLRQWAIAMRQCADELDVLSEHKKGLEEHSRLFYASQALKRLASKVNRIMGPRRY